MDNYIFELMDELRGISETRKRIRRKLFRVLRSYYLKSSHQNWTLDHKIRLNWLSDLTDRSLIRELESIYNGLPENLKQEWRIES